MSSVFRIACTSFLSVACLVTNSISPKGLLSRSDRKDRRVAAFNDRVDAAQKAFKQKVPVQRTNEDRQNLNDYIGSFHKCLTHDANGIVNESHYEQLLAAVKSGKQSDLDAITLHLGRKLANPQAAHAHSMVGCDGAINKMPAAPGFTSAESAGEMVELYWATLLRDVPFNEYGTTALAATAAADISGLSDFKGPKDGGNVTADTLFRGTWQGELTGPYVSQFLYLPVPSHATTIPQVREVPVAGITNDFMTTESECQLIQNGGDSGRSITFDATPHFIRNARDLGDHVHLDFPYEAYMNATLILLSYGSDALDDNNPYKTHTKEGGFVTYGAADILELVARVSNVALKAAWYQKWLVHLRLRPEYFGLLAHQQKLDAVTFNHGIHNDLMNSPALDAVFTQYGSYLLSQQFPEGSPAHPSYPAGHATVAGACATILKAFFNEDFVIPNAVEPNAANTDLVSHGGTLTVGGELNKLASNISIGRNLAGVHYRSDGTEGMLLGEKVAISILKEEGLLRNEQFSGFTFTKFNGKKLELVRKRR